MNILSAAVFPRWLLPALGLGWFAALFVHNAWLFEDSWISFRSIEQMHAGNGTGLESGERVQVYTSVAWYWLGNVARLFTTDYMLVTLFLSGLCCAGMLALLRRFFVDDLSWLAIVILLTTSRGVMDFSSSGLENPLGYLLVVVVALCWREVAFASSPSRGALVRLFAAAAWVPLARHDLTLLVLPACAQALWLADGTLSVRQWAVLLGCAALPLLAWTAFALIYYGMPFPNSYYAKAAAGIPRYGLLQSGINHYYVNLFFDPVTVIVVLAGTWCLLRSRQAAIGLGLLLNLLYILWIGGDYMMTRFLTYSFVLVLACGGQDLVDGIRRNLRGWRLASVLGLLALFAAALWLNTLQGAMLRGVIAFYREVLWLGDEADLNPLALDRLSLRALLLCVLLLCLLVWLPGAGRLGMAARRVNALALVIAGMAYLQFNPLAALQLTPSLDTVAGTTQFGINNFNFTRLRYWLNYRLGERRPETIMFRSYLANYVYLDGQPQVSLPKFPDLKWRKSGEYLGGKSDRLIVTFVGISGFGAGIKARVFDVLGITEPYLARLNTPRFSPLEPIAHWTRAVAPEYFDEDLTDTPWRVGGDYQLLARDVQLATRSTDLWSGERWQAVWRLMRDNYDLPVLQDVYRIPGFFMRLTSPDACHACQSTHTRWTTEAVALRSEIQRNWQVSELALPSQSLLLFEMRNPQVPGSVG